MAINLKKKFHAFFKTKTYYAEKLSYFTRLLKDCSEESDKTLEYRKKIRHVERKLGIKPRDYSEVTYATLDKKALKTKSSSKKTIPTNEQTTYATLDFDKMKKLAQTRSVKKNNKKTHHVKYNKKRTVNYPEF
ncbi:hypothetical protein [Enterococcus faecalis]|uniref:hypothetical protein n=1 Tax=Enterococcus faecalis TaxID=1351 RepID=UPI0034CE0B58